MKKIFALILALVLAAGFCACSSESKKATYKGQDIDIDLAELSTTAAYSEASNMTTTSNMNDYKGKIVRVKGTVVSLEGVVNNYYAVEIADSTACCNAYIEFVLEDGADYPEDGEEITVCGVYNTYLEAMQKYAHLEDAIIE